jgi:hypothetical protein
MSGRAPHYLTPNPGRVAPQIQHSNYPGRMICFPVVDAERKAAGQHTKTAKVPPVNAVKESQALDVREP